MKMATANRDSISVEECPTVGAVERFAVSGETAMSTTTDTHESGYGGLIGDLEAHIGGAFTVGTDKDDRTHHYYRRSDQIVVYEGRDLVGRYDLDGRPIDHWVEFVTDEGPGWATFGPWFRVGVRVDRQRKQEGV